jgi:hypothetical protein
VLGQQKVKAAEPVSENQEDVYEVDDSPKIGPNGPALNNVIIFNSSINLLKGVKRSCQLDFTHVANSP